MGQKELCEVFPLSECQVEKFHPKHHAMAWTMPLHIYSPSVWREAQIRASQHIPKPMKQSILEEHQVVFLHTSITHGQGQVKQSDSRAYADELGALVGWCTLLQRCPQRRDLSLRLSLATISSLAEAASSSAGTVPGGGSTCEILMHWKKLHL